ncbi:MAG: hypothetical protein PHX08_05750, partial [Lachnospiraceae bacterium]|nr:hypothetical protein [Lachnospiraceae bacterium]
MEFHEKLDFLMNITKTSNSSLGKRVNLDSSHLSRLRRGQRGPLKDEAIIGLMADYFARHCAEDYQCRAIEDALKLNFSAADVSELGIYIKEWLMNKKQEDVKSMEDFLNNFKVTRTKPEVIQVEQRNDLDASLVPDKISVYYGSEGKRQATEYFLKDVIARN